MCSIMITLGSEGIAVFSQRWWNKVFSDFLLNVEVVLSLSVWVEQGNEAVLAVVRGACRTKSLIWLQTALGSCISPSSRWLSPHLLTLISTVPHLCLELEVKDIKTELFKVKGKKQSYF